LDESEKREASVEATLRMADAYAAAARELLAPGRRSDPFAQAPGRLLALHATELYLSAWLRQAGESGRQVRARQHDLAGRAGAVLALGLGLRRRTACHLARANDLREYLVVRYDPDGLAELSQVNRLLATLEEVAHKVRATPAPARSRRVPASEIATGVPPLPLWQTPAARPAAVHSDRPSA
jgi:hypothetical protein